MDWTRNGVPSRGAMKMRIGQRSANDGTRSGFMPPREPGPKGGRCAPILKGNEERPFGGCAITFLASQNRNDQHSKCSGDTRGLHSILHRRRTCQLSLRHAVSRHSCKRQRVNMQVFSIVPADLGALPTQTSPPPPPPPPPRVTGSFWTCGILMASLLNRRKSLRMEPIALFG